jgi:hypothetical protein
VARECGVCKKGLRIFFAAPFVAQTSSQALFPLMMRACSAELRDCVDARRQRYLPEEDCWAEEPWPALPLLSSEIRI